MSTYRNLMDLGVKHLIKKLHALAAQVNREQYRTNIMEAAAAAGFYVQCLLGDVRRRRVKTLLLRLLACFSRHDLHPSPRADSCCSHDCNQCVCGCVLVCCWHVSALFHWRVRLLLRCARLVTHFLFTLSRDGVALIGGCFRVVLIVVAIPVLTSSVR